MKRPGSVVVCGQPFTIEWDGRAQGRLHDRNTDTTDLATIAVSEQRIIIRDTQGEHSQRDAVLHEVAHAILAMTGHDEIADAQAIENMTGSLAVALLAVLRHNPELVAWLVEDIA